MQLEPGHPMVTTSPFRARRRERLWRIVPAQVRGVRSRAGSSPPSRYRFASSRTSRNRTALAGFGRGERGGSAIENSIAIAILVAAFAGLMEIVNTVFESDRMDRAARAAADAAALDPSADACAAIRRELRLDEKFDCSAWTITVHQGVLASKLEDALQAKAPAASGDMVLVRIDWSRTAWSLPSVFPTAHAAGEGGEDGGEGGDGGPAKTPTSDLRSYIAIGLARSEPQD